MLDGLLTGAMEELAARKDLGRDLLAKVCVCMINQGLDQSLYSELACLMLLEYTRIY